MKLIYFLQKISQSLCAQDKKSEHLHVAMDLAIQRVSQSQVMLFKTDYLE